MKSFARYYLESFGVNTDNLPDEVVNEDFRNVVWDLRSHFSEPRRDSLYTHNEAGYLVPKFEIEESCVACKNYIPGGECLLVGGKVNPGGTCQHWQGWTEDVPRMDGNEPTKRIINWNGLKIGITHESGDRRFGYPLRDVSYGRIYRSHGQAEDGKAIDCWIGSDLSSDKAFWFQQLDPEDGSPDEMKLVIGFPDRVTAKQVLQDNLPLYLREVMFGGLFDVSPVELDAYRANPETKNETKSDTLGGVESTLIGDRLHYPPVDGYSQSGDRFSVSSRGDSSRPSCLICVEKHLSNALILADEISQGYPQFRPLLVGNLSQASDEAVTEYPELAEQIRDMRHRYQIDGIMPMVDEVYALLDPYYSEFEPELNEPGFVVEDSASVGMPARSLEDVEGKVQREDKPDSSNDLDAVYAKYRATVNMSASELKRWADNEDSKKASLDRSPIKRNLRLLSKPKEKWTQADIRAANQTISFVGRMKGAEQGKPVDTETDLSKRDISLRNWAYDPKKRGDAIEDAPNYRLGDADEYCMDCIHSRTARPDGTGWINCDKFDFEVDPSGLCDDFDRGERGDARKIWVPAKDDRDGYWRTDPRTRRVEPTTAGSAFLSKKELDELSLNSKNSTPSYNPTYWVIGQNGEQFLLKTSRSIDAAKELIASEIAIAAGVPCQWVKGVPDAVMNKGVLSLPDDLPGTLHRLVPGKPLDQLLDMEQVPSRYERINFIGAYLNSALSHPDLARISAFDAALCNPDRHEGNLMYEDSRDRFYAIDNGHLLNYPRLTGEVFQQVRDSYNAHGFKGFTDDQRHNLRIFGVTLERITQSNTPDAVAKRLTRYTQGLAGELYDRSELDEPIEYARQSLTESKELARFIKEGLKR